MPIREYQCKQCGNTFEVIELGDQTRRPKCLSCGSKTLLKKLSLFSSSKSTHSSCRLSEPRG